jgi:hypothetical protein
MKILNNAVVAKAPAHALLVAASVLALTGCDTVRKSLGMERTIPDETVVATNRPLVLPPDYNLRPPASASETASGPRSTSFTAGSRPDTVMSSSNSGGVAVSTAPVQAGSAAAQPPQKERGFFGRVMNSWFGDGKDEATEQAQREEARRAAEETVKQAPASK